MRPIPCTVQTTSPMQIRRVKGVFSQVKYLKKKKKEKKGKYLTWQYSQDTHVWSSNCKMSMFEMANMRSALFGVI